MRSIIKLPGVMLALGIGKTKIYELIELQQFPPGMPLFGRSVGWFDSEIELYQSAMAAGLDDNALYELCAKVVTERERQLPQVG